MCATLSFTAQAPPDPSALLGKGEFGAEEFVRGVVLSFATPAPPDPSAPLAEFTPMKIGAREKRVRWSPDG